jgi:hypothetical protein
VAAAASTVVATVAEPAAPVSAVSDDAAVAVAAVPVSVEPCAVVVVSLIAIALLLPSSLPLRLWTKPVVVADDDDHHDVVDFDPATATENTKERNMTMNLSELSEQGVNVLVHY